MTRAALFEEIELAEGPSCCKSCSVQSQSAGQPQASVRTEIAAWPCCGHGGAHGNFSLCEMLN